MTTEKNYQDFKLVFESEEQAEELLTPVLNKLKIWHYVQKVIGVNSTCLVSDEETGECLEEVIKPGWHVDVRVVNDKADWFNRLDEFKVNPEDPIHAFAGS